jgi:hypothetical protein
VARVGAGALSGTRAERSEATIVAALAPATADGGVPVQIMYSAGTAPGRRATLRAPTANVARAQQWMPGAAAARFNIEKAL